MFKVLGLDLDKLQIHKQVESLKQMTHQDTAGYLGRKQQALMGKH
jgi:hypothetical protein